MMKVSICVPTYNNLDDVKRLMESIAKQDYKDFEVCISDDSTDHKIERYIELFKENKTDINIEYVKNRVSLGHIFNWNAAMKMAKGEYIKIMFSDDYFTNSDSLGKFVKLLEDNNEADLAFSNSMQVDLKTMEARQRKLSEGYIDNLKANWRYVFISNQIGAPSDVIVRNKGYMFDEKSNWASDVFWYMNILSQNPVFNSTEEPLVSIGLKEEQYTNSFEEYDDRKLKDYQLLFDKYELKNDKACSEFFAMYKYEHKRAKKVQKLQKLYRKFWKKQIRK